MNNIPQLTYDDAAQVLHLEAYCDSEHMWNTSLTNHVISSSVPTSAHT
jgi:hypothetical protein